MIKQIVGISDLGIYTVAVTIAELLFLLPISIHSALIGRLYNLNDDDNGRALLANTLRLSLYLCAILMIIGMLGSLLIPLLYGDAFKGATLVTIILLPGVLFACIPKIASPWFFTSGRPKIHLVITLGSLLLNIILNSLLIPSIGISGAALASTISYFVYGAYYVVLLVKREGFPVRDLLCIHKDDVRVLKSLMRV